MSPDGYGSGMTLAPIGLLYLATGAAWFVLGAANLAVLLMTDAAPLFGWALSLGIGVVAAALVTVLSMRMVRVSLDTSEPAAGVLLAAPSEAVGRCIGPVALATAILFVLALVPAGDPYQGLAAALFLCFGASYLPLAGWVRRFEEAQGVIVTQPVNRYGMRSGPVRTLRLPR